MAIQLVKPDGLDRFDALTFSPDGIFLYFNAEPKTDDPPSVYRVSSLGGTPTKILTNATSVEFSPDGKQVSFGRTTAVSPSSSSRAKDKIFGCCLWTEVLANGSPISMFRALHAGNIPATENGSR